MHPSTSPIDSGFDCGTTRLSRGMGSSRTSIERARCTPLVNWIVPATASLAPSRPKCARTVSTKCRTSKSISTNTYMQRTSAAAVLTSTGTRQLWP